MRAVVSLVLILASIVNLQLFAQTDKVNKYLKMVADGKVNEVKLHVLDLLAEYPNDPGVRLLHGVVLDDAFRALEIYKQIVEDNPESQWADDAYWRIVQFYAILGDTIQARKHLEKFKDKYPSSEFLAPASDVLRSAIGVIRSNAKRPSSIDEEELVDNSIKEKKTSPPKTYKISEQPKQGITETMPHSATSSTAPLKIKVSTSGTYGLQVGIFSTKDAAIAEMNRYLRQRMRTEVREKTVDGEVLYAVVIGNYSSRSSAEAAKQIVKQQCNCNPIVFEK